MEKSFSIVFIDMVYYYSFEKKELFYSTIKKRKGKKSKLIVSFSPFLVKPFIFNFIPHLTKTGLGVLLHSLSFSQKKKIYSYMADFLYVISFRIQNACHVKLMKRKIFWLLNVDKQVFLKKIIKIIVFNLIFF